MQFSLSPLGSLIFGQGTVSSLSSIIAAKGYTSVSLITSASFAATSRCDEVVQQVQAEHVDVTIYTVSGEPTVHSVDSLSSRVAASHAQAVVGIGGGSALDTAKAVAVMACALRKKGQPVSVKRYLEGVGEEAPPADRLPLIAIPTTAGTGSEATKNAVIAHVGPNGFKKSLRHEAYIPDSVIIDPLLSLSVPRNATASSGLDALTQLLESYLSTKSSVFTDSLALPAIGMAQSALLRLLDGPLDDPWAREKMAYGAYISGITMTNAGLGYIHAAASPLGALHAVPHGVVCGLLLAPIVEAIQQHKDAPQDKLENIARLWQVKGTQGVVASLRHMEKLASLSRLSSYGFTEDELITIGSRLSPRNSPVVLAKEQLVDILLSVW